MQKSFEVRFPEESEYENLKALWQGAFDDTPEALASFFEKSLSPCRILAAFDGEIPVSALYMLESEILIKGKRFSAYYIYAVCTHPNYRRMGLMKKLFGELFKVSKERGIQYLFLVPEEEYLFGVYKNLGFKTGFFYGEKILFRKDFPHDGLETEELTYPRYIKCVIDNLKDTPVAALKESTFKSFFNSASGEVRSIYINNAGYALFEETKEKTTVYELFGDENILLKAVFKNIKSDSLIYRYPEHNNSVPYGMYYKLFNAPEIENGFFGIPYSA